MNQQDILNMVGSNVLATIEAEDEQLNATLAKLDEMKDDELDRLRERRRAQMKKQMEQKQIWKAKGHGEVSELADQHQFFQTTKTSKQVVVLFYTPTNTFGPVIDKHMITLAPLHMETKFCKINAEKAEYLVNKLNVWMMPTIMCIKDQQVVHQFNGLVEFGGTDAFSSTFFAYHLSQHGVLKYDGPAPENPFEDEDRANQDDDDEDYRRSQFISRTSKQQASSIKQSMYSYELTDDD